MNINYLIDELEKAYGPRELVPHRDALGELIQTILSQNTTDKNSRPAYQALRREFPQWEMLLQTSPESIAVPIRSGGLALIKARRIQDALKAILQQRGSLDLSFLNDLSVEEGIAWLKSLKGVGDKTANCVLLFALGKPALPVDTHVYRVSKRLGLIKSDSTLEEAHRNLIKLVPPSRIYPFHVLMIEHGRRTCTAQRPHCRSCIMESVCPGRAD
jgi:endonuclease III